MKTDEWRNNARIVNVEGRDWIYGVVVSLERINQELKGLRGLEER